MPSMSRGQIRNVVQAESSTACGSRKLGRGARPSSQPRYVRTIFCAISMALALQADADLLKDLHHIKKPSDIIQPIKHDLADPAKMVQAGKDRQHELNQAVQDIASGIDLSKPPVPPSSVVHEVEGLDPSIVQKVPVNGAMEAASNVLENGKSMIPDSLPGDVAGTLKDQAGKAGLSIPSVTVPPGMPSTNDLGDIISNGKAEVRNVEGAINRTTGTGHDLVHNLPGWANTITHDGMEAVHKFGHNDHGDSSGAASTGTLAGAAEEIIEKGGPNLPVIAGVACVLVASVAYFGYKRLSASSRRSPMLLSEALEMSHGSSGGIRVPSAQEDQFFRQF
mmetsp:Transcript_9917/g.21804  ORF Transcript_9917/g.21804 Transcript_9917/m.21804 type:complete len:336 (+) Transcript_9917:95-1102(+)